MVPVFLGLGRGAWRGGMVISGLGTVLGVRSTSAWARSVIECQACHPTMWISVPWLGKETSLRKLVL